MTIDPSGLIPAHTSSMDSLRPAWPLLYAGEGSKVWAAVGLDPPGAPRISLTPGEQNIDWFVPEENDKNGLQEWICFKKVPLRQRCCVFISAFLSVWFRDLLPTTRSCSSHNFMANGVTIIFPSFLCIREIGKNFFYVPVGNTKK